MKQLSVTHFKSFNNQAIDFSSLTLLAGTNASGKSSVIQAILLFRTAIELMEVRSSEEESGNFKSPGFIPLNGPFNLALANTSEIFHRGESSDSNITLGLVETVNNNDLEFSIQFPIDLSKTSLNVFVEAIKSRGQVMPSKGIFHEEFHYLNAERLGPRLEQDMSAQEFPNVGPVGEHTGQVIAENLDFSLPENRWFKDSNVQPNKRFAYHLDQWLNYILPGIAVEAEVFSKINKSRIGLRRKYATDDFLVPTNIGFGVSYVLPIIVSGLLAKEGCMLIVENPEAHLHPQGQSRIGKFLAHISRAGVQVIIETHSEHVVNGIRISSLEKKSTHDVLINFFSQEEKALHPKIESIPLTNNGDPLNWPLGFFDQREADFSELIKAKRNEG